MPLNISGLQKGPAEKGPRQKTSKIVKKCQKAFRHFSTIFAQGKKRQKSSKSVKKFFDTFRQFSRGPFFPAPFAIRWKHSYTVECGNRLRVGVRAKNAPACRGLRVGPSKICTVVVYRSGAFLFLRRSTMIWGGSTESRWRQPEATRAPRITRVAPAQSMNHLPLTPSGGPFLGLKSTN